MILQYFSLQLFNPHFRVDVTSNHIPSIHHKIMKTSRKDLDKNQRYQNFEAINDYHYQPNYHYNFH